MEQTKCHSEHEHLEECQENVTCGEVAEGQGQRGGEASVEDGRPNVPECLDSPLVSRA